MGIAISQNKKAINYLFSQHYIATFAISLILYASFRPIAPNQLFGLAGNITTLAFAFIVLLITYKIKLGNPILCWMGKNLFPLYIYQRLPMMLMASLYPSIVFHHPILFMFTSTLASAILAHAYKFIKVTLH